MHETILTILSRSMYIAKTIYGIRGPRADPDPPFGFKLLGKKNACKRFRLCFAFCCRSPMPVPGPAFPKLSLFTVGLLRRDRPS